jgi:alpha-galactosidase
MSKTIVLIGAGSAIFGFNAIGDIFQSKLLEGSKIVLHDIDADTLKYVNDTTVEFVRENDLPFTIYATTDRREALSGADFCVNSIEVGNRFINWDHDWKIPLQYGISQVYGENGGPGGLFHALRIIPPILDICSDVMEICPDAYFINLSNPMVRISHAVHTQYPDLKYIGLCHEVGSLVKHLPILLNTPLSNLEIKAGGLNHFSILVEANYKDTGMDAYPDIRAKAPEYFTTAPTYFGHIGERRLFQKILKYFDYLPITTDSHFGEYISWAHDVVDNSGILYFYDEYKRYSTTPRVTVHEKLEKGTSEQGDWNLVSIISGIIGDTKHTELAVNIPNDGFIDLLPYDHIVEVPAIVDKEGIQGIKLDNYPLAFGGLLQNQVAVTNLTTEAVLNASKKAVIQALLVDPVVNKARDIEEMVDVTINLEAPYLDYLK